MPLKTETVEEPTLNLTPMIDIVFLLIIFFMVGTQFAQMENQYDIQLPTIPGRLEAEWILPCVSLEKEGSLSGSYTIAGRPRALLQ